jgi:hypothetical protein
VGSYNGGLSWALPLGWQEAVVKISEKIITRPGVYMSSENILSNF